MKRFTFYLTLLALFFLLFNQSLISQTFNQRVKTNLGISIGFPSTPRYTVDHAFNTQNYSYAGTDYFLMLQITALATSQRNMNVHENHHLVVNNFIRSAEGTLISSKNTFYKGVRCVDFDFSVSYSNFRNNKCRAFVHGNSLITIIYAAASPEQATFDRFVNSLKFE